MVAKPKSSKSWLDHILDKLGNRPRSRDELIVLLRYIKDEEIISNDVFNMMEKILHVADMQVSDIMIPTAQMISIQHDWSLEHILPVVIDSGHSRFPVLNQADGNVVGILLAKDLLPFCFTQNSANFNLTEILRPIVFTSESQRLDVLLREFRKNRNHLAIVPDEYGYIAGLVTIEDVLEQIVGDIDDEYDTEENDEYIKKYDRNIFIVKAQTPLEEFNKYFNSHLHDANFDTIGGIVLHKFGRFPERNETIKLPPFRIRVLHCDTRRLHLLEVKFLKNVTV